MTSPPAYLVTAAVVALVLVLAVLVLSVRPRRQVRPRAGVRTASSPWPPRRAGRTLQLAACAVAAATVGLRSGAERAGTLVVLLASGWLVHRRLVRRRSAARRAAAAAEAAPAVVDLLAACLLAGLNGHLALVRVAERTPAALRSELDLCVAALRLGRTPAAALRVAADRTGLAELRAAAGALEAAERWGAPPAEALVARATALRARLRLQADADAGRAAVQLTFPLILCFLPAFVLLTVVPLLAGAVLNLTR